MRYEDAIAKLFALQARGMRMGIERMRAALRHRGFDPASLPIIQVAGTNGKGSVSAMIASSLSASGHRTGLFTSPHLHRFTERVCIDGRPIGTREAARRIQDLLAAFEDPRAPEVSFFELSALLALEAFRDHSCDVAVLEVGLGGRLDATNALPAVLTVITRIALDHTQMLGSTIAAIAREKAGILKRNVPAIVGSRDPKALAVIERQALRLGAKALFVDRDFQVRASTRGERFTVVGETFRVPSLHVALAGRHQRDNAACAVAALCALRGLGYRVPNTSIRAGLATVRWPARLELIPGRPRVLLDAAHNPDGCEALARHLQARTELAPRGDGRRVLVFGVMGDKDYVLMLRTLAPLFDTVIYASPAIARAKPARDLCAVEPGRQAGSVALGLALAKRSAGAKGLVVVAGSLFLVAEARAHLLHLPSDPPIRM